MIRNTLHAIAGAAILVRLTLGPTPTPTAAQLAAPRWDHLGSATDTIEAITIHPPDALAADCVVVRRDGGPNSNLLSLHSGDGTRNEDWHSWREPLLAPFDAVVLGFQINPESTLPGVRGSGCSSAILFQQLVDGEPTDVHVAYVHVREVTVSQGDTVRAGDPVARIGNNGSSFHPHVHVGAFRREMMSEEAVPLQVRMDLGAMGVGAGGGGGECPTMFELADGTADRNAGVGLTSKWLSRRKAPESPTGWLSPADMSTLHSVVFCLHLESIRPFGRRPSEGPVHGLTQAVTRQPYSGAAAHGRNRSRTPNPAVPLPVSSPPQATPDAAARSPELLGPMCGSALEHRGAPSSWLCSTQIR